MKDELQQRTKQFAVRIIKLFVMLKALSEEARIIGRQLVRSGTSVGAHYRESVRARSKKEMISKLQGGQQELEETLYWMELLIEAKLVPAKRLNELMQEADEIMAMLVASARTLSSDSK